MVLHAFDKALHADVSDFAEFAEQVKSHQRTGKLTSNSYHRLNEEENLIIHNNHVHNNAPIEGLKIGVELYEDISQNLSPLHWLDKRKEQVRAQKIKSKNKMSRLKAKDGDARNTINDQGKGYERSFYSDKSDSMVINILFFCRYIIQLSII
jgi:hypothetical protein